MNHIGDNIRLLRTREGWTQAGLAKLLDVHTKYVSAMERGKNEPSPAMVEKLCAAFSVDELHLRFGERTHPDSDLQPIAIKLLVDALSPLSESEQFEWLSRILKSKEDA